MSKRQAEASCLPGALFGYETDAQHAMRFRYNTLAHTIFNVSHTTRRRPFYYEFITSIVLWFACLPPIVLDHRRLGSGREEGEGGS